MSVNIEEAREEMRGYIGDIVDSDDFSPCFDEYVSQDGTKVNSTRHILNCIVNIKNCPAIQEYVFRFLERNKADVDIDALLRRTCLAYYDTNVEMIQFLIDLGAKVNGSREKMTEINYDTHNEADCEDYFTPLQCIFSNICYSSEVIDFIDLLVKNGADINECRLGSDEPIRYFLNNVIINNRFTTEEVFKEIVMYLFSKGATCLNLPINELFGVGYGNNNKDKEKESYLCCLEAWNSKNIKCAKNYNI